MDRRGLAYELRRLAVFLAVAGVVGGVLGAFQTALLVALFCLLFWHLYKIRLFEKWVSQTRRQKKLHHDFGGIWAEIADDIVRLGNRYRKDKMRLQAVVNRVQEITSALTDAVILLDKNGNIEWWNSAGQHMFDFRNIDLGHRLTNLIRHPKFIHYFEDAQYQEPLDIESVKKPGRRLQFQIHPFGLGEKLVIVRDSTRVYKLEQMRRDFVANVSHELRTPLTVLLGYLETMTDSEALPDIYQVPVEQMRAQGDRMRILIDDLITLTQLETSERDTEQVLNLHQVIQNILQDATAIIGTKEHNFIQKGDKSLRILGNEKEIHSAISNLIFNAINYSPNKCNIVVKCKKTHTSVVVSVKDSGIGIDPKHLPRLAERFYRVDDGRTTTLGGTGLGLAIAKHVLLRHDGELKIRSWPGKGSTFTCHFPLSRYVDPEDHAA